LLLEQNDVRNCIDCVLDKDTSLAVPFATYLINHPLLTNDTSILFKASIYNNKYRREWGEGETD
jgi:hypothetical protein